MGRTAQRYAAYTPTTVSRDYATQLDTALRIARRACREIVEIIEDVDRRCEVADGDVTPTLQEMTQAELRRIYEAARRGAGPEDVPIDRPRAEPEAPVPPPATRPAGGIVRADAPGEALRALTIHQPYASLLFATAGPGKTIETRGWGTRHRGRIAIHAGLAPFNGGPGFDHGFLALAGKAFGVPAAQVVRHIETLPRGAVIGEVTLADCFEISAADLRARGALRLRFSGGGARNVDAAEAAFGNYNVGRWAWITTNPSAYDQPIPAQGRQGLWSWCRSATV